MGNKSILPLKRNSDFLKLKKAGKRVWVSNWLLLNYQLNETGTLRFGVTVSRKVGPAVLRNRLKRWCREYFRQLSSEGLGFGVDLNVVFKPLDQGFYKGLPHEEFHALLDRGFKGLRKKSDGGPSPVDRGV